jgi:hypothetical protein
MLILFSFWSFLIGLILEGNLLYFSYLFAFELNYFYSVNWIHGIGSLLNVFLFFWLVFITSSSFFLHKYFHGGNAKYFFEDVSNSKSGAFHMIAYKGLRLIFAGIVHMMINDGYGDKLYFLGFIEMLFLFEYVLFIRCKLILLKIGGWVEILSSFIRILLLVLFYYEKYFTIL